MKKLLLILLLLLLNGCSEDIGLYGTNLSEVWVDSFIQKPEMDGMDIVWIMDRSCSMQDDVPRVETGIGQMIEALDLFPWRIGIISSDPAISVTQDSFPLVPGDSAEEAEGKVGNLPASDVEWGFSALISFNDNNPARLSPSDWMRPSAGLYVVFVSDEEEQSPISEEGFQSWFLQERPWVGMASIINVDNSCTYGSIGTRYINVTEALQGIILDLCAKDWGVAMRDIASSFDPISYLDLSYSPIVESIRVYVNGDLQDSGYIYQGPLNRIVFLVPPSPESLVEVAYLIE